MVPILHCQNPHRILQRDSRGCVRVKLTSASGKLAELPHEHLQPGLVWMRVTGTRDWQSTGDSRM
jgi:hypothetical protein